MAGLAIALLVAGVFVLRSEWFKNKIRERIVSVTERATGGRVEIGSFSYNWRDLTAEVAPFVLHGTEPASAPPLFHADKIKIRLRIISLLEKKVDIASLGARSPASLRHHRAGWIHQYSASQDRRAGTQRRRRASRSPGAARRDSPRRWPTTIPGRLLSMLRASNCKCPCATRLARTIATRAIYALFLPRTRGSLRPNCGPPPSLRWRPRLAFDKNAIQLLSANLASGGMKLLAVGTIGQLSSPHGEFDLTAALPVQDLNKMVRLPIEPRGDRGIPGPRQRRRPG